MTRTALSTPYQVPADSKPTLDAFTKNIGFTPRKILGNASGLSYVPTIAMTTEAVADLIGYRSVAAFRRNSFLELPPNLQTGWG